MKTPSFIALTAIIVVVGQIIATNAFRKQPLTSADGEIFIAQPTTNSSGPAPAAVPKGMADEYHAAVLAAFREEDPARRSLAFGRSFAAWFEHDPEAALDWLRKMPQGTEYTQGLFLVLPKICANDPQRALVLAASMATTREQKFIYNALFDQLAKSDLSSAPGWLRSAPAGEARENALRAVMDNWSARDAAAALEWAKNLEEASEKAIALESILTTLAVTDPQKAATLAGQNLEGGALERVLQKSLKQLAVTDPVAAAEAVGQLPEGDLQQNSATTVARVLAIDDPANTAAWTQTLPTSAQTSALNSTLDFWLRQDAVAAGKFVSEMSAGSVQDAAVRHLAEIWAEKDPAAAVDWAGSLSNAPAQDAAIISLASGWARIAPAAAVRWAADLPAESSARLPALRGAYSYWELADKSAAENFFNDLSTNDRNAVKPPTLAVK